MRREPSQYANCSPDAISRGSPAQMKFFVEDAKHDIAELLAEVERLREAAKGQLVVVTEARSARLRAERSRDMWKGQIGRQAEELTKLRETLVTREGKIIELITAYADENQLIASDTILHDPILSGGPVTPTNLRKSSSMTVDGCIHSAKHHAAKEILALIAGLK